MKQLHFITVAVAVIGTVLFTFAGCTNGPRDIDYGKEECAHCRMTIADSRFAAELVTTRSKVYVYDAIECLAATLNDKTIPEENVASIWVMRYDKPGVFIDAAKAWYLRSDLIRSPMGMNLSAFETEQQYAAVEAQADGLLLRWTGVRLLIAKEWK
jgi:copper chaperone NosL